MVLDREVVQIFISDTIHVTSLINTYVENIKKDSINMIDYMIEVEHQLERLKSQRISQMLYIYAQWKVFVSQQETRTQE